MFNTIRIICPSILSNYYFFKRIIQTYKKALFNESGVFIVDSVHSGLELGA